MLTSLLRFLIDVSKYDKLVLSAERWTLKQFYCLRSLMYNKNRGSPGRELNRSASCFEITFFKTIIIFLGILNRPLLLFLKGAKLADNS